MRMDFKISTMELLAVVIAGAVVAIYLRAPASAAGFIYAVADLVRVVRGGG